MVGTGVGVSTATSVAVGWGSGVSVKGEVVVGVREGGVAVLVDGWQATNTITINGKSLFNTLSFYLD